MSKPLIKITDWQGGIINDTTNNSTTGFKEMKGVEIWRDLGTVQNMKSHTNTLSAITGRIFDFVDYGSNTYCCTSSGFVYQSSADRSTWTQFDTVGDLIYDLAVYGDSLFYAWRVSNTELNVRRYNGATTTTDLIGIGDPDATSNYVKLKVFQNRLYAACGNLIYEMDDTYTWSGDPVFTLGEGQEILTMEVLGNELAIGTSSGKFYLWDGSSDNASQIIQLTNGPITALLEHENTLFAWAGTYGTVMQYTGADFVPVVQIPNFTLQNTASFTNGSSTFHGAVRRYKNGFVFGVGYNGVYIFNRTKSGDSYSLVKLETLPSDANREYSALWMYNVLALDEYIIIAHDDNRIAYMTSYNNPDGYSLDTQNEIITGVYDVRNSDSESTFISGASVFLRDETGQVKIQYKIDNEGTWSDVGTFTTSNETKRTINRRANKLQFKFILGNDLGNICELEQINIY